MEKTERRGRPSVVLVVGSCGLDRLLRVPSYPTQDSKIRTTAYHEEGGGNAANTACALSYLLKSSALGGADAAGASDRRFVVRLASKVGGDAVGERIVSDLRRSGVELSPPLFRVGGADSTTGFTTIIVSEREKTRTCLHTPGTCGELTLDELGDVEVVEQVFQDVVHLHSDSRHTDVSLFLAKEARKRGIPVSLDVEKDRGTKSLDLLLEQATIVFTNSGQLKGYLDRLELEMHRRSFSPPVIRTEPPSGIDDDLVAQFAAAIRPSAYFTRSFRHEGREVVITKGSKGSFHIKCEAIGVSEARCGSNDNHEMVITSAECSRGVKIRHSFIDRSSEATETETSFVFSSEYILTPVGVLQPRAVVDTTGAGDAFIAGFIAGRVAGSGALPTDFAMKLGAWVGGKKVEGPGARSALPTSNEVDERLGSTIDEAYASLCRLVGGFGT
jgi:sugar/nucleoside kinase (ribokinase family)